MAHVQRLKLTLRHRVTGREWTGQPVEVTEDPEDGDALLRHMDLMARDLDGRSSHGWLHEYELRVQGVEGGQEWRDFRIVGEDR